jgi:hypothetical protein
MTTHEFTPFPIKCVDEPHSRKSADWVLSDVLAKTPDVLSIRAGCCR